MSTLGDKVKYLRGRKNITQKELSNILNVPRDTVANWEVNRGTPNIDMISAIADYFSVTTDYLLGRDGFLNKTTRIPLLGTIRAGLPILAEDNIEGYLDTPEYLKGDFVLRVTGDSMIGVGILEGDYVICKQSQTASSGQIVVALRDEGSVSEATLKYFYDSNGSGPVLRAANPNYAAIHMNKGYRIAGVMVALIREEAPGQNIYRDYLMVSGHEEWTGVIELSNEAGIKPAHLKAHVDMLIEMGKRK